ncbi:hypothetical protein G7074_05390 [Pedobacter sp. HDW13]|uniref:hypothetical protein n=1 Tax=unclassified Pedobacter TaxID=2628915 RepID=UPI000F59E016|nr:MULTISPECIES: hypothetical protein [unclassified Pedobacter]QIL38764.1 hypothetical protein G7074_05390 [Pedobacter sp. HDW13]RQO80070.1 hypothetical protein DBR40_00160 [Pedobacter sp. KBW01]
MENKKENNENLGNKNIENNADKSNMPDQQVPRHRSNDKEKKNTVETEAGNLGRNFGMGDFGSEEARTDAEKGNKGDAGNMPTGTKK